jgi:hypothetical protein
MTTTTIEMLETGGQQWRRYPLPPIMLVPIIVQCAVDHRTSPEAVRILHIEEGYGRHHCDDRCPKDHLGCLNSCDDSDWIVTLEYTTEKLTWENDEPVGTGEFGTWHAVYGVKDGKADLWMD